MSAISQEEARVVSERSKGLPIKEELLVDRGSKSIGTKDDTNKLPYHLLSGEALEEVVRVLQFGASKYSERGWENGIHFSRVFSASMRHLWAWWRREPLDPESGITHLAHALCCIMFLLHYELKKMNSLDDRP